MQADPLVEDAFTTQGINRFAYVLNNPLSLTDPTGHLSWSQARPYVGIAVAIALGQGQFAAAFWGSFGLSMQANALLIKVLTGAIAGAISTGSVQGAVIGAFSAGLNHGIGNAVGEIGVAHGPTAARTASIALHGIRGGIVAELQGGKFGSGFVSAGLTETFSPVAGMLSDSPFARAIVMGVIGGTISELSGDKFANGAGSAVFAELFNHVISESRESAGQRKSKADEEMKVAASFLYQLGWTSAESAATGFAQWAGCITEVFGFEVGAVIAKIDFLGPTSDSVYRITEARVGADDCFAAGAKSCGIVLPGRGIRGSKLAPSYFADVHVYPSRLGGVFGLPAGFSRSDLPLNTERGRVGFVWESAYLQMHRFNPAELRPTRIW